MFIDINAINDIISWPLKIIMGIIHEVKRIYKIDLLYIYIIFQILFMKIEYKLSAHYMFLWLSTLCS